MTFDIKLKTGFFKTQSYFMTIEQGQIILTPRDNNENRLIIEERNLRSIYLYKGEFEIITDATIITGIFSVQSNLQEVSNLFNREFGEKFMR